MAESESSELLDVSPYEGGNMLNSGIFRTTDIRWISANLDMREGKAFWQIPVLEQWPCRFWFHVPTEEEWEEVASIVDDLWLTEDIHEALLLPKAWKKTWLNTDVDVWDEWYYHTRIPNSNWTENVFHPTSEWSEFLQMAIKNAISVRWFKNNPVVPTRAWAKLPYGNRPRLPAEYQEVEYIESAWYAYINTWILSKNIEEIEMDVSDIYMWSSYADQYSIVVFGTTANSWWFSSTYYTYNWARFRYHKAITWGPHDDCNAPQTWFINHLVYTRTQFTVNGNVWTQVWTDPSWTNADEYPVCFWYCGNNSKSRYKLYNLKITTNSWVKTFVPCFRKADWVIWLFELSEGEFYTNAWTWAFLMWSDVWYLPQEYEQVEYLLNTTWDEYIDLWIVSNNSLKVSLMITPTQLNSDNWFIWWIWSASDFLLTCYNSKFRFHNGWNYIDTSSVAVNNKYNIWLDNTWILVNENRYWMNAGSSYGSHNLWIYHIDWQTNTNPRVKFYALRVWNQWEFVRDYVPCIRTSDGVLWFYDLVNRVFCPNQWGWAFVAGPSIINFNRGFLPSNNTMLYVKMNTDLIDYSWKNVEITNSWVTLNTSVAGVWVWCFDWNSRLNFPSSFFDMSTSDFTISFWCRDGTLWTDHWSIFNNQWTRYSSLLLRYAGTKLYWWTRDSTWDIWNEVIAFDINQDVWVMWTIIRRWSVWAIYKNNVLTWNWNSAASLNYNSSYVWAIWAHEISNPNYYIWYISNFIVERCAWTDKQRQEYFNATKSLYWIS